MGNKFLVDKIEKKIGN